MIMEDTENSTSYYHVECLELFAFDHIYSNQPGTGFYIYILVYTLLAFLFVAPLMAWSRNQENKRRQEYMHRSSKDNNKIPSTQVGNIIKSNDGNQEIRNYDDSISKSGQQQNQRQSSLHRLSDPRRSQMKNSDREQLSSSSIGTINDITAKDFRRNTTRTFASSSRSRGRRSIALRSVVLRELDQTYPDQDPDFQSRILRFSAGGIPQQFSNITGISQDHQKVLQEQVNEGGNSKQPTETSSSVPSAATTSKIHKSVNNNKPSSKGFSKLVLDVGGRRWKNRRPIGRVDVISKVIVNNPSSVIDSKTKIESISPGNNSIMKGGRSSRLAQNQRQSFLGMSDVASSILSEQYHQLHHQPQIQFDITLMKKHQLEQLQLQQRYQMQQQQHFLAMRRIESLEKQQQQQKWRYSQRRISRNGSRSTAASERSASVMSSIVDDISPDDAPDANDPGRGNIFVETDENYWNIEPHQGYQCDGEFSTEAGCCSSPIEGLLALVVPDQEKWKIFQASIPLALGASSEALFRLITIAFISQFLGTESLIAFLLVGLFVRLTSEELSGAIIDSLSSFVQASINSVAHRKDSDDSTKINFLVGQYIQLALMLQIFLTLPLLSVWAIFMEPFVMWLVDSITISQLAHQYTFIVVFAYMVQALSRTLTVVFHICGHEHFESVIDLIAAAMQVIAIACVVVLVDNASLELVAYIQVLINVASAVAKVIYPATRGWMKPFRRGLFQNIALIQNKVGIWHLLKAVGPLLLGAILEYGEWEILTIFISHLGPAEVVTWALLGAFWDFFEALTEGIGEASANQLAYLLSLGATSQAKNLCYGVIYMAVTEALLVTSALYMSGQYLAVLFTTDPTIQHLMNNTIVMIGFANVIMTFSQIVWSLVGAQGRFRLATFVIFISRWLVTMPCALISIYVFTLDLNAVSGSLVVGYATASSALMFVVLRSDWDRLARLMQVMNQPVGSFTVEQETKEEMGTTDAPIFGLVNLDDFDDSSDDSDGFG